MLPGPTALSGADVLTAGAVTVGVGACMPAGDPSASGAVVGNCCDWCLASVFLDFDLCEGPRLRLATCTTPDVEATCNAYFVLDYDL